MLLTGQRAEAWVRSELKPYRPRLSKPAKVYSVLKQVLDPEYLKTVNRKQFSETRLNLWELDSETMLDYLLQCDVLVSVAGKLVVIDVTTNPSKIGAKLRRFEKFDSDWKKIGVNACLVLLVTGEHPVCGKQVIKRAKEVLDAGVWAASITI